jgi:thiol-disulfide isomerase/thioredoxin
MQPQSARIEIQLPIEGEMLAFDGATGWLNSKPLTRDDLRGKVVLVEFWTYTCINWLRTAPYVRAWAEKYKDKDATSQRGNSRSHSPTSCGPHSDR